MGGFVLGSVGGFVLGSVGGFVLGSVVSFNFDATYLHVLVCVYRVVVDNLELVVTHLVVVARVAPIGVVDKLSISFMGRLTQGVILLRRYEASCRFHAFLGHQVRIFAPYLCSGGSRN